MARKVAAAGPVEGPWALPDGWRWERIDAVAPINPRRGPDNLTDDAEVAFVPMAAVEAETGAVDTSARRPVASVRKGFTRFGSGDVIFAKITPCMENGKVAVIPDLPHGVGFGSTEFHVLAPQDVSSRYLYYWISQRSFREDAEFNMTGTAGQKRVPTDFMRDALVPVPPRPVQDVIVARIDELFAEIDDGEAALARAQDDLVTWRKALLNAAVTGKLTAEWRAYDKESRDKRLKRFSEAVEIKSGFAFKSAEYGLGSVPLIRIADVAGDEVRVSSANARMPDYHLKDSRAFLVKEGDILLTLSGSVGRSATYRSDEPALLNQRVCRIRCRVGSGLSSAYAQLFLSAMEQFIASMGYGGSQANVSPKQIADLPIFLPEEDEQLEILRRVNDHIAERDLAVATRELTLASSTLRQSILAAAFRGELA